MSLTTNQISRLALAGLRGSKVNVKPDDIDELDIYVEQGFDYLEEEHTYDPKQYGVTSSSFAVRHFAMWQFCAVRPDLINLAQYYEGQFEKERMNWAGVASTQVNISHNEYPENRTRVVWNNEDPLGNGYNEFGVDPNRLGT